MVPRFSVIVPILNDWEKVPGLLGSLAAQELPLSEFEVLLVDNGSDQLPRVDDHGLCVTTLSCTQPGSYAARNLGVRHAKGEVCAFTDADCLPCPEWLSEAGYCLDSARSRSVVAGDVRMESKGESPGFYELYDVSMGIPQAQYVSRGYAVTANLFVPRTVFESTGLFDSKRFSGGDAEFCRRAKSRGFELSFCKGATVRHPARQKWTDLATKARRMKGAQLTQGSVGDRCYWLCRTLLPPVHRWVRAFRNGKLSFRQRLAVCLVQTRLWGVELLEAWRVLVLKEQCERS